MQTVATSNLGESLAGQNDGCKILFTTAYKRQRAPAAGKACCPTTAYKRWRTPRCFPVKIDDGGAPESGMLTCAIEARRVYFSVGGQPPSGSIRPALAQLFPPGAGPVPVRA